MIMATSASTRIAVRQAKRKSKGSKPCTTIRLTRSEAINYLRRIDSINLSNGALVEFRHAAVALKRNQSFRFSRKLVEQVADSLHWAPPPRVEYEDNEPEAAMEPFTLSVGLAAGIALAALLIGIGIGWATGDVGEGDDGGTTITVTNEGDGNVVIGNGDDDK
jgi:hypothetical protein